MKLHLTKRAVKQYKAIQEYLDVHWGEKVVRSFQRKTLHLFNLLEGYPELGSLADPEKNIRGMLLTKHIRVFYRIKDNQIIILSFFDVRQNPKKK